MHLKSTLNSFNRLGQKFPVVYSESDPLVGLEGKILQGVCGFCFCGDKMVLVYASAKGYWAPPGGGIEPGETYEQALVREVKEETNMRVLSQKFIGFQDVYEPEKIVRQTRSFCIVEPYGDFVADPDGDITEIKLIDPADYKKYFDWGEVGDIVMKRAMELNKHEKNLT